MLNLGNRIVNNWIHQIEDGWVLIDTGYENGYRNFIKKLSKSNINLDDIQYIF